MNVTFHIIASIAMASIFCIKKGETSLDLPKFLIVFVLGVLVHGVLDYLPHQYPISSKFDVGIALCLFFLTLFFVKKQNCLLLSIAFIGGIFPDLVDLSAGIADKYFGLTLPQLSFKIFPWHWKKYSGSIYDGSREIESAVYHISVLLIGICVLIKTKHKFLRF
jgi:hypothetical protein